MDVVYSNKEGRDYNEKAVPKRLYDMAGRRHNWSGAE